MHSDPIADMLARIRNGLHAGHVTVDVPMSRIKLEVLAILEKEGFIKGYEVVTEGKFPMIRVHMKYDSKRKPIIQKIRRVSRPGLRIYRAASELRPIRSGLATLVLTTSEGVMSDREARKRHIGGEVLCEVW
jgi:small subunit ribosomal protein S8